MVCFESEVQIGMHMHFIPVLNGKDKFSEICGSFMAECKSVM